MPRTMLLILCILMLLACTRSEAKEWRGIIPLHSTRADVERLMGAPADSSQELSAVYKLEEETVLIFYASGPPCGDDAFTGWQVPRGTVVSITVSPKRTVRLSELGIDLSRYKKTTDLHRRDNVIYMNVEEGESINTFLDEVTYFTFFPAAKDKCLSCPRLSTK